MSRHRKTENILVDRSAIVFGEHSAEKRCFARRLRREMTVAETILWQYLRGGRLGGFHFRRQQIIDGFIVDFFCLHAGLVIEVDGAIHDDQALDDALREAALERRDLRILRFSNDRIEGDIESALNEILRVTQERAFTATRRT